MRLSRQQVQSILDIVHSVAGTESRTLLFGSRLDDGARGGDIDLLVESEDDLSPLQRASLKLAIEARIGLPADVLSIKRGDPPTAFQQIALAKGVELS